MPKIIGAPTLDDALLALRRTVSEAERRGEKTLIFCEDRLTLLAERAVLDAVGGTFDTSAFLAKKALTREVGSKNPRKDVAENGADGQGGRKSGRDGKDLGQVPVENFVAEVLRQIARRD